MNKIKSIDSRGPFGSLFALPRTPFVTLVVQPFWAIPHSMYAPFLTVYMVALGINDIQLGLFATVGMLTKAVTSFIGGALIDKYGRRKVIFISDTICWCGSALLYAFGANVWWFLAATVISSFNNVPAICYNCLLFEDAKPEQYVTICTWAEIVNLLDVFFTPIMVVLLASYALVPTVRELLLVSVFFMFLKFLLHFIFSRETVQGKVRIEETKDTPFRKLLTGYSDILKLIMKMPQMKLLIVIQLISSISSIAAGTFGTLYITRDLGIAQRFIPIFPIISAAIKLLMMTGLQTKLNRLPFRSAYIAGYLLSITGYLVLLLSPGKNLPLVLLYIVIDSVSYAFIGPRMSALQALFIHKEQRARMTGLFYILLVLISSPFGYFVGRLSAVNTKLPFAFSICMIIIMILIAAFSKNFALHTSASAKEKAEAAIS
jgi:MFS family permease